MRYRRALLLLPGAFGPSGGLEMYDRLLIKVFADLGRAGGMQTDVLVLNDSDQHVDSRYLDGDSIQLRVFSRSRPRFATSALAIAAAHKPDLVLIGHVNFAPLAFAIRALVPRSRSWFVTYGVDFWRRLSRVHRAALRRAEKILAISEFTR